ncbi:YncE family protein [Streptosporangium sp. NPDC003464]
MRRLERERRRRVAVIPLIGMVACALSACGSGPAPGPLSPGGTAATAGGVRPGGTPGMPAAGSATPGGASAAPVFPGTAPMFPGVTGPALPGTTPPDAYAHGRPGMLGPAAARFPERVYVPNSESDTVTVIDPRTYRVLRTFEVGRRPQHVVPSWDMKTLWVNNTDDDSLTPIDPRTGRPGKPVHVDDPYNLYFTPDGRTALVLAERENRLDFLAPRTMRLRHSMNLPCRGINHADFTADRKTFLVSCELSGHLVAVDMATRKIRAVIDLADGTTRRGTTRRGGARPGATRNSGTQRGTAQSHDTQRGTARNNGMQYGTAHDHGMWGSHTGSGVTRSGGLSRRNGLSRSTGHDAVLPGHMPETGRLGANMPQDVRLSPDGTTFYVADMARRGVWLVDAEKFRVTGFIGTGRGAHGLYVSRDSRLLYVSNRGAGSVTVISLALRRPVDTWHIPGGGSPDMGGVSADGSRLWLSGRYDGVVYVFDTRAGRLIRKIKVGAGPHGLSVYPQPGRYPPGRTGILR